MEGKTRVETKKPTSRGGKGHFNRLNDVALKLWLIWSIDGKIDETMKTLKKRKK